MAGRGREAYWAAVAAALVLIVGGTVLAYVGYERTGGADGAVKGYFAALRRGDAPDALGYGDIPAGSRALLTSRVLREQLHVASISNLSIVAVHKKGDAATVDVRYDLAFPTTRLSATDSIPVVKRGTSWRLTRVAALTKLDLVQAGDRASIAGSAVPDEPVLVFPGAVPIKLDTPYLMVDPDSAIITLAGGDDTTINVVASDAGRAAAHAALNTALASCVTASADSRCPLPSARSVPGSVRGALAASAANDVAVVVTADPTGSLEMVGTVRVVGRYDVLDFNNVASTKRGAFKLQVDARAYPRSPLTIRWQQVQP
jgi:hypothetical protein